LRATFEAAFHAALLGEGDHDEAARMLWKAARAGESLAILALLQRLAPETKRLKLTHEVNDDGFDYSKLSEEQLRQLEAILDRAGVQPLGIESGESAAPPV
jgi:hypothetical protein